MTRALTLTVLLAHWAACPLFADDGRTVVVKNAIQPQIALDPEGCVFVVYLKGGNVEVAVSRDGGESFDLRTVAIDGRGRARGGRQRGPRIGVDGQGRIHVTAPVCFDPAELEKRYPAAELWYTRSSDGARTFSEPLRINEVTRKAAEALHWLAVDPAGDAHVAWLDARDGGGQAIYYARIHDGKVGTNRRLARQVCECCAPGLAVDGKGNPWLAYREGGDNANRASWVMRGKNGGKSWSKPARLNRRPSNVSG